MLVVNPAIGAGVASNETSSVPCPLLWQPFAPLPTQVTGDVVWPEASQSAWSITGGGLAPMNGEVAVRSGSVPSRLSALPSWQLRQCGSNTTPAPVASVSGFAVPHFVVPSSASRP